MIEYRIDHDQRVVFAKGRGTLTDENIFEYQRGVWSRSDTIGYDELMDMREVEQIALPSIERVRDLANLSAMMDVPDTNSKFAIVATDELAFGLGRLYETYREMDKASSKKVAVFRSMEEALNWLGVARTDPRSGSLPHAADRE